MNRKLMISAIALSAALGSAAVAFAQAPGTAGPNLLQERIAAGLSGAEPPRQADPNAPAHNVSQAYADRLMKMPDFNGVWDFTQPKHTVHVAVFDPSQAIVPYQWSDELPAFGPNPGTYEPNIPYNPKWAAEYKKAVKDSAQGRAIDDSSSCKPNGMPRLMAGTVGGFDLVETPDVIVMSFGIGPEHRFIFMDGRPHPAAFNPDAGSALLHSGHSVGHFEGNTLVVDTVNMMPTFYDQTGARHSDQVHMVEHLTLVDANTIRNDMVIEDPVAFTKPWEVTRYYVRNKRAANAGPNHEVAYRDPRDRECNPMDMSKGYQAVVLPQELEAKAKAAAKKGTSSKKKVKS